MYLNGIVLVSSVLDFQTIRFAPGNNLTYVLFLPHYTATAWYHKKLPAALQQKPLKDVLKEAADFAAGEYSIALFMGNRMSKEEADKIAVKLAGYTGLSLDYIKQTNLRIRHDRFIKELLRSDFQTVGRLDSRFKGRDADAAGETYEFDPASAAIQGAFSTMFNHYVRTELGYKEDLPYAIYGNVYPWNFLSSPDEAEPGPMPSVMRGRGGFGGMNLNVAETPGDERKPVPPSVLRQRLLRWGHPLLRDRIHLLADRSQRRVRRPGARGLLRGRPHDVHPQAVAYQAQGRPGGVH
jgi:hypothetical protein